MLPVAEEHKKILIVEPAVADQITGDKWNRYIFRTGRNSSQDAISNAVAIGKPGVFIATLAQDYAFGRDGVAAFKQALGKTGATLVTEEYAPANTTDFTAPAQRLFDALKDKPGRKIIWVIWAGGGQSARQIARPRSRPLRHRAVDRRQYSRRARRLQALSRHGGRRLLLLRHPEERGERLVCRRTPETLQRRRRTCSRRAAFRPPWRWSTAVEKAKSTDSEKLIAAMEGMAFDTPKGKMIFRKEDHQALQSMYHFKIKVDPARRLGDSGAGSRVEDRGHGHPDPQQALRRRESRGGDPFSRLGREKVTFASAKVG